jgi:glycine dehydrogenase subunit 1
VGSYIPNSKQETDEMLRFLGLNHVDELFESIPESVKIKGLLNLPEGKSEMELSSLMGGMAGKNTVFKTVLRGAGVYNHYIPSIVKSIVSKERFITAYTPYQPEISQGILQAIFEYQSIICELTHMDASNASVYDGASAAAEAVAMCTGRRKKVLVSETAKPDSIAAIKTYCKAAGRQVAMIPSKNGVSDIDALSENLGDAACFYVEMPNFNGIIEDYETYSSLLHEAGTKHIMGVNPISLALLKTPDELGADIAVGEGQPLGLGMNFGGPHVGFMAAKSDMVRKLPGRIVGETTDRNGKRAYVLTLQAREQHIRREKASSNICSNQALCALTAVAYVGAMGSLGLTELARQCYYKAHYAAKELENAGLEMLYPEKPFFHEFVTKAPRDTDKLMEALAQEGILGGLPVKEGILWCFTEMVSKQEIDKLCAIVRKVG